MGTGRTIFGIFLVLVIIAAVIFTYVNRDILFMNEVHITYPDGCIEKYVNTEMVTSECTEGRRLLDEQNKPTPPGLKFPVNININETYANSNYTSNASKA